MLTVIIPVILFIILVVTVYRLSVVRVPEDTLAVITRLGKFHKVYAYGTHFRVPVTDRVETYVSTLPESEILRVRVVVQDGRNLNLSLRLQWELWSADAENIMKVVYLFKDKHIRTASLADRVQKSMMDFARNRSEAITFRDEGALTEMLRVSLEEHLKWMGYRLSGLQLKDLYEESSRRNL